MNPNSLTQEPAPDELVLTRVFNAPRELVWKAWSEAEHLAQWWGPIGCIMRVEKLDFRPGGVFHYAMQAPDGLQMYGKFVFRDIAAPERLVFVSSFADADGNTMRAPFAATFPLEIHNTLTLSQDQNRTTLVLRGVPLNAGEEERRFFTNMHTSMQQGWAGTFDQLAAHVEKS